MNGMYEHTIKTDFFVLVILIVLASCQQNKGHKDERYDICDHIVKFQYDQTVR